MINLKEIQKQIAELQKKANELIQSERQPIIEKIKEEIKTYEITASELGFKSKRAKKPASPEDQADKKVLAPKYQHGENLWSGRGRPPGWLLEFEANGGKRDEIKII